MITDSVKVNKQLEGKLGILSLIRDHKKNKEQLKTCETREVTYTHRYTSERIGRMANLFVILGLQQSC